MVKEIEINSSNFIVSTGKNSIDVDCTFNTLDKAPILKLEIRTFTKEEKIVANK